MRRIDSVSIVFPSARLSAQIRSRYQSAKTAENRIADISIESFSIIFVVENFIRWASDSFLISLLRSLWNTARYFPLLCS